MAITFITPHQRPNSGGVHAIHQFARVAAAHTEVHLIVAKGPPVPLEGVHVHGAELLERLELPHADALVIPADMRRAEPLFGLPPDCGMPMLLFQGFGTPDDPIVRANLVLAPHALCTASWLVEEAVRAGATATLVRYGLDREIFKPGPPSETRGPVVGMMTHSLAWKGTADGVQALRLARRRARGIQIRLFGKLDPGFKAATLLASPNEPSDVAALLRECAVFVCSSWEEGFGIPGIEAIVSGAALATTDTKGCRDYAFHDRTALVSPPRDPQALAENILTLVRDAELRRRLVSAGRAHIDATYPDWSTAGATFVAAAHAAARAIAARRNVGLASDLRAELDATREELARVRAEAQAERAALQARLVELGRRFEEAAGDGPERALAEVNRLPSAAASRSRLAPAERAAKRTFASVYQEVVRQVPPSSDGRDPLALPLPLDLHRMLVSAGAPQEPGRPRVDVVVCVHDALDEVRRCLWSLLARATRRFHLIVVNDGSEEPTSAFLRWVRDAHPALTLIEREDAPHGYTLAANAGLRASSSDYVVLLNSDTVVSHGWLERIVAHGELDPSIGILGPLSNAATHQSVPQRRTGGAWADNPLPSWLTEEGVALLLERAAPRARVRLPFINGFCYVIRRAVIDAIGYFDEQRFAAGYAEENDYSQRARDAGFDLAVVDDAFVYHAKSRSYGAQREHTARRGYEAFLAKHGREKIGGLVAGLEADAALEPARAALARALSTPDATVSALGAQNGAGPRIAVAFVLPGLGEGGSGGSHSIYQEARGLRELGVAAKVLLAAHAWERARSAYDDAEQLFEPFADTDQLIERTADANVIVATHFKSVPMVAAVRRRRADFLPAYYVQDYEPMFTFADSADNREAAGSYAAIPDALLFAKAHWICNLVSRRHGLFVAKIEPSIDTAVFHARARPARAHKVRVVAMIRPRTPRRQPAGTLAVLERLLSERTGSVEVATFGCSASDLRSLTSSPAIHASHAGVLKRAQVAELLSRSDIFLDMSIYQAFGRTAVEAMACGCVPVVPGLGGVWEFVEHGRNAFAVDTLDHDGAFSALASLVDRPELLGECSQRALATGSRYSIMRAAISEYVLLSHAFQARMG